MLNCRPRPYVKIQSSFRFDRAQVKCSPTSSLGQFCYVLYLKLTKQQVVLVPSQQACVIVLMQSPCETRGCAICWVRPILCSSRVSSTAGQLATDPFHFSPILGLLRFPSRCNQTRFLRISSYRQVHSAQSLKIYVYYRRLLTLTLSYAQVLRTFSLISP